MHNHPNIFSGATISFDKLALGGYTIGISDSQGSDIPLLHTNRPGGGTIDLSVRLVPRGLSQAGWVLKRNAHMFSTQYRLRYIFMVDGNISYCDDEQFLDRPRATILRQHITLLEFGPDKSNPTENILHIKSLEDEEWFFKFLPEEKAEVVYSWLRKLQYANPHVKLNGEGSHLLVERTENLDFSNSSRISMADSLIGIKNTVKVAGRRASNLF